MAVDIEVIKARLKKLDEYQRSLARFEKISLEEYQNSDDIQTIVERKLQLSIQACIDIANYIIVRAQLSISPPELIL